METDHNQAKRKRLLEKLALVISIAGLGAILVGLWRKRKAKKIAEPITEPTLPMHPSFVGLSEKEAEAKRLKGLGNALTYESTRSIKDILRENTLTIFNFSLVGVAFVQLLLGLYWDMLLSFGIALLNISINVFQEMIAIRRLQELETSTRPEATVMREGKARSIDPSEIVQEDLVVIGPGDQIQVDGRILSNRPILVDESVLTGKGNRLTKNQGDMLYAGSFCISGRATYQAEKVGAQRLVAGLTKKPRSRTDEHTPLEKIVERVLRVMLYVVLLIISLKLIDLLHLDTSVGLDTDTIISRVSVIFRLAPAGLYFMIFLNYTSGIRQLARQGALIRRARSVETLANASTLWVSLAASRAGLAIRVEDIMPSDQRKGISDTRMLQILGDFGHTSSSNNRAIKTLAELFPGDQRSIRGQTPFLSVYGWAGVAFDEDDLRGVYVLGDRQVLNDFLAAEKSSWENNQDGNHQPSSGKDRFSFFKRFRRRPADKSKDGEEKPLIVEAAPSPGDLDNENLQVEPDEILETPKEGRFRRFFTSVSRVFTRKKAEDISQGNGKTDIEKEKPVDEVVYIFAYFPELIPLYSEEGRPQLPKGLIPLCYLHYTPRVNTEVVNTILTLRNYGVNLKAYSTGDSSQASMILEIAGVNQESAIVQKAISGSELVGLDKDGLYRAADENTIFSHVTSDQTKQLVVSMREHGDTVAVFGGNPTDLPIMRDASLSITSQSSSQAALSTADIILLKNAPRALSTVMEQGQTIVKSLLDILKLYLTQLAYLTMLILVLWAFGLGFPYLSQQGSFIGIATLTLPSLGLSLWKKPGGFQRGGLSRQLGWFVGPAAFTISIAGVLVFIYFLEQSNRMAYAQLALTHMLVISGLILSVMVHPPKQPGSKNKPSESDWRTTILAIVLFVVYLLFASLQIAFRWFRLTHLQQLSDYFIIGLAIIAWVVTVQIIWRLLPVLQRKWEKQRTVQHIGASHISVNPTKQKIQEYLYKIHK